MYSLRSFYGIVWIHSLSLAWLLSLSLILIEVNFIVSGGNHWRLCRV